MDVEVGSGSSCRWLVVLGMVVAMVGCGGWIGAVGDLVGCYVHDER